MSVLFERNIEGKMRDGTILRADVWRPNDDGRHPVLVTRHPYGKRGGPGGIDPTVACERGYAVIVQDARGRFDSEGEYFPFRDSFDDGYDTVEWAASLPFSDGTVGMFGGSYSGVTSWQAAVTAPPSLRAIVAAQSPGDIFHNSPFWRGGALCLGLFSGWALAVAVGGLGRGGAAPDSQGTLAVSDELAKQREWVWHLPLSTLPVARPEDPRFAAFFFEMLAHPYQGDLYASMSATGRHHNVRVPALTITSWFDHNLAGDLQHYRATRDTGATAAARDNTCLIIGPWLHGGFATPYSGDLEFGPGSTLARAEHHDFAGLTLHWCDRWLRGIENGAEDRPRVRAFVMGRDEWRSYDDWPPPSTPTPWYVSSGGNLGPSAPATGEQPDTYVYDPADPSPTRGGPFGSAPAVGIGPIDQGPILGRPDVLVYTSDPLTADLDVVGEVRFVLYAATSAPDTDWMVKLCVVESSGRTVNICDGLIRARYRDSMSDPKLLEAGTVQRFEIDMWSTAMTFRAGTRLRVLVTSSDFPRYDRNPNTGRLSSDSSELRPATQTIFHDAGRASHIVLPVVA